MFSIEYMIVECANHKGNSSVLASCSCHMHGIAASGCRPCLSNGFHLNKRMWCRSVVMVPDSNMEAKDTQLADEVLTSLQDFDPSHWGLPAFAD